MDKDLFDHLITGVSLGREHTNYFIYAGELCTLECHRFPATDKDYVIVSVSKDEQDSPDMITPLLSVDPKNLKMLIEQEIK